MTVGAAAGGGGAVVDADLVEVEVALGPTPVVAPEPALEVALEPAPDVTSDGEGVGELEVLEPEPVGVVLGTPPGLVKGPGPVTACPTEVPDEDESESGWPMTSSTTVMATSASTAPRTRPMVSRSQSRRSRGRGGPGIPGGRVGSSPGCGLASPGRTTLRRTLAVRIELA